MHATVPVDLNMTETEDKTGRHGWASKIPLVTLLVFVFAAGGAYVEARFTRKAVDDLATSMRETANEQKQFNTAIDQRQTADEIWRAAHEAAVKEQGERKRR